MEVIFRIRCEVEHPYKDYEGFERNDTDPPVTTRDGRKTVKLLEYIEESLNKNLPVKARNYI